MKCAVPFCKEPGVGELRSAPAPGHPRGIVHAFCLTHLGEYRLLGYEDVKPSTSGPGWPE